METGKLIIRTLAALVCCLSFAACSSDDDEGGSMNMSQLVGSEWKSSYSHINDDGSYEDGNSVLTFTSSNMAECHTTYQGKEWKYDYDLDFNDYKTYHGERTTFYSYTVSGNIITMTDLEDSDLCISYRMTGNKLVPTTAGLGETWTLSKAGSGSSMSGTDVGYNWSNMKGVWAEEDVYRAALSEIGVYESQGAKSDIYLDLRYEVHCIEFDAQGCSREYDPYMRVVYDSGYPLLLTIYAPDKTVYWTDLTPGKWGYTKYIVVGDEIYYDGSLAYEIINSNLLLDVRWGCTYCKVK